ncbi:MAG TPA: VCBS repeat-containing protein, partial [Myxococcaceae bacterium]|nr:VCBS repeat-containing protein [Myxococcaceae bacterium]
EGWLASPALIDLDGDRRLEIVTARHSILEAWTAGGVSLWRTAAGYSAGSSPDHGARRIWSSPAAGDFDGDGDVEIAIASDFGTSPTGNVALYDHTGRLVPGWPAAVGRSEARSLAAADVTGDGKLELIASKIDLGPSTAVFSRTGELLAGWPQVSASCSKAAPSHPCLDDGGYNQNVGAGDLDGDRVADVVTTWDRMGFGIFRGDGASFTTAPGFADRMVAGVESYHDPALAKQGWGVGDRSEFTDSPPVIADVDLDGAPEVVLVGDREYSETYEMLGASLWVLNPDASRPRGWEWPKNAGAPLITADPGRNIVQTLPSPAVADLDGQPGVEIVFPASDGYLHVYGGDGVEHWKLRFGVGARPYRGATEPVIADLNRDGRPEIVFATFSTGRPGVAEVPVALMVVSAAGEVLHQVPLPGRGAMAAPSIADLEGDGDLEIVLSLKDSSPAGGVQIFEVPGSGTNCLEWPTARGNLLRTGAYPAQG